MKGIVRWQKQKKTESFTIQIPEGMHDAMKLMAGLYDMNENDYVLHALQIAMIADGLPPVHSIEEDKSKWAIVLGMAEHIAETIFMLFVNILRGDE